MVMLSLKIAVTGVTVALLSWAALQASADERMDVACVVVAVIGLLAGLGGFLAWVWS